MMNSVNAFLFFMFLANGQSAVSKDRTFNNDWKKIVRTGYSIQCPEEWEFNESGKLGTTFLLLSPLETNQDQFRENVNLYVQNLSGMNYDLNKFVELSEGQLNVLVTNSTLIESSRIQTGSDEYHRMIYSGDQGIFHFTYEQYYWFRNDIAYVLTFTCEQDKFLATKELAESILNSFRFEP